MREVLSYKVQVLLGAILRLSRVDNKPGRILHGFSVFHEVIDPNRTRIMVGSMIGNRFPPSRHRVFNILVEAVCRSLVYLQLLEDSLEGVISHVDNWVIMHLIALKYPHRCQDKGQQLPSLQLVMQVDPIKCLR